MSIFCIFQTGAEVSVSVRRSEREIDAKGFAACHSPEMFWNNWLFHSIEDQTVSILQNSYFSQTRWKLLTSFLETLDYCYDCKEKRKDIFMHLIWKCTYLDAIDCMLACDNVSMHHSIYACCKTFLWQIWWNKWADSCSLLLYEVVFIPFSFNGPRYKL